MTPSGKGKSGRKLRGSNQATSADLAGPQGRGPAIPPLSMGNDTLLGVARSIRRILPRVATVVQATGGTGGYAESTVVLNDAYNGGTSAIGYTKYMAFYSKCFVVGASLVHKAVVTSPAAKGCILGITTTTNSTTLGSYSAAIGNGMCEYRVAFANPDRVQLTAAVDVKRFLNKPFVLDDPQLFSTSSASPSQLAVAHFWIQSTSTTAATQTAEGAYELLLDCVFTDPIPFT